MEKTQPNLDRLRHSCAHLLAAAVMELWPDTKRAIGPAIEHGFYFDFDFGDIKISEEDLSKIEEKMRELLPNWESFKLQELSVDEAKREYPNNEYKHELIDEFANDGERLSFYKSGNYMDLCRGGHVENPSIQLKHFKLLSIAGAYWRGDEKNNMLTRIYGTCFPRKEELDKHLWQLEEAKKRDHRKLAKQLDLIVFSDLVGSGLPMYTPKGAILRNEIYNYSRVLNDKIDYQETAMPNMNRAELFKISGHYAKYKDDMFRVVSNYSKEEFFLKPMNCPQHCAMYMSKPRSYRELPIRYADFSVLYRDERPGELHGLLRSRAFTQDDGHCFCTEDQIGEEFERVLTVVKEALKTYGFDFWVRLSLRDPNNTDKYLGNNTIWNASEKILADLVKSSGISYKEGVGDAAIYGPKLDFMVTDSLGRQWQLSTIQLDMNMPSRFKLEYIDKDGKSKTPIMIHRAIIGSERFIAILIEHYGGKFPLWLSPVQITLIPITDKHVKKAKEYELTLKEAGIRVEVNDRSESMQAKIRHATLQKIPFMGIIGDREVESDTVSVRTRDGKSTDSQSLETLIANLKQQIDQKT